MTFKAVQVQMTLNGWKEKDHGKVGLSVHFVLKVLNVLMPVFTCNGVFGLFFHILTPVTFI